MKVNKFKNGDKVIVEASQKNIDVNNMFLSFANTLHKDKDVDKKIVKAENGMVGTILFSSNDIYCVLLEGTKDPCATLCRWNILKKIESDEDVENKPTEEDNDEDEQYAYQIVLNINLNHQKGMVSTDGQNIVEFESDDLDTLFENLKDVFKKAVLHNAMLNIFNDEE